MEISKMSIGDVIKNRRIALNLKQEYVAEQMNVTVQTISKWERDASEPKATFVPKLSKVLKVSERELCNGAISESDFDIMEFIKTVEKSMAAMTSTEFIVELHNHIENKVNFIECIGNLAGINGTESKYIQESKYWIERANNGGIIFDSEDEKRKFYDLHNRIIENN